MRLIYSTSLRKLLKNPFPNTNLIQLLKSKYSVFVNLPKFSRSKKISNNLSSNFEISYIPMVVYGLNPFCRSGLSDYKQIVLQLSISQLHKGTNSVKCCCNKYNISFLNNDYGHIKTENLNIINDEKLCQLIIKVQRYRAAKQINIEVAREEIQIGIN